jgi:hypothetical protein
MGGRVGIVPDPDQWRAGHRYLRAPLEGSLPQMLAAVNRMACAISPAATSSQRTSPGKIGNPAASADVQPAGRSALE